MGGMMGKEEEQEAPQGDGPKKPAEKLSHQHWAFHGMYAPVDEEVFAPLSVRFGKLPSDLQGAYLRNGPNPLWNMPAEDSNWHWFFGDGMVHCVRLGGGKAVYHNHFLRTNKFLAEQNRNGPIYSNIAHATSMAGFLGRLVLEKVGMVASPGSGTSNTNLAFHNSRLMALCEADQPLELQLLLDGHLESAAHYAYEETWNAHPKVDPLSGKLYWMNYDVTGQKAEFTFGVQSPSGECQRSCSGVLPGGKAVMIHDCGITERFAIAIACPVLVGIENFKTEGSVWRYDASHGAQIGIFPKDGESGQVNPQWFQIEPCYIFHIANSWEEGQTVVLVVVRWGSVDMKGHATKARNFISQQQCLWEYRFNLEANAVEEKCLSSGFKTIEFPVINPSRVGSRSCFAWAMGNEEGEPTFHRVYKFDLSKAPEVVRTSYAFCDPAGLPLSAGEACFVPRESQEEDDGYLVTFVKDPSGAAPSAFYVLDATRLEVLAILDLPVRVPAGFHGLWLSDEQIASQESLKG